MRISLLSAALLPLAFLAAGCGPSGPAVYRRSGTVTFNGQPVPLGKIYFDPDVTAGGSGPSGFADIVDGKYDTSDEGRGAVSGPVIVRVTGFSKDDPDPISGFGKPLFAEYQVKADLPSSKSEYNVDVPASAAKGLPKNTVPLDP
jgi:hypothetical protein